MSAGAPKTAKCFKPQLAEGLIQKADAVYLGAVPQRDGRTHVLPIAQFAHELACGELP